MKVRDLEVKVLERVEQRFLKCGQWADFYRVQTIAFLGGCTPDSTSSYIQVVEF